MLAYYYVDMALLGLLGGLLKSSYNLVEPNTISCSYDLARTFIAAYLPLNTGAGEKNV